MNTKFQDWCFTRDVQAVYSEVLHTLPAEARTILLPSLMEEVEQQDDKHESFWGHVRQAVKVLGIIVVIGAALYLGFNLYQLLSGLFKFGKGGGFGGLGLGAAGGWIKNLAGTIKGRGEGFLKKCADKLEQAFPQLFHHMSQGEAPPEPVKVPQPDIGGDVLDDAEKAAAAASNSIKPKFKNLITTILGPGSSAGNKRFMVMAGNKDLYLSPEELLDFVKKNGVKDMDLYAYQNSTDPSVYQKLIWALRDAGVRITEKESNGDMPFWMHAGPKEPKPDIGN